MKLHHMGMMFTKTDVTDPATIEKFQHLLDATHQPVYTKDRRRGDIPEGYELVSVKGVANPDLWGKYMARREELRQELEADPSDFVSYDVATSTADSTSSGLIKALADDFSEPLLDSVNEVFLFHGTSINAANAITASDFRIKLAGERAGTLYGRGLYFAESVTKSDEYTTPLQDGCRHLLLCRVLIGRVYYLDTVESDPRLCEEACLRGKFHTVLGDRKKAKGTFREFIVFDEDQVYPNYVITYRRKTGASPSSSAGSAG